MSRIQRVRQAFDSRQIRCTDRKDAIRPRHSRSSQRLKSHRIRVRFTLTFQIAESVGLKANFAGNTYWLLKAAQRLSLPAVCPSTLAAV
jgi:hypothetical protein